MTVRYKEPKQPLTEGYVRRLLSADKVCRLIGMKPADWPEGFVRLKQKHLKLVRMCRKINATGKP